MGSEGRGGKSARMKGVYPRASKEEVRRRLDILNRLKLLSLEEKTKISYRVIRQALSEGDGCVLYSGGRDSTVLLDLVQREKPNVLVMYNNTTLGDPAQTNFIRKHCRKMNYTETKAESPVKMWHKKGYYPILSKRGFTAYKKRIPDLRVSPVQCCYQLKEKYANRVLKAKKTRVVFWGNRADESMRRRFVFVDNGFLFQPKKYPWLQAYPLQHWTDTDINKYIARHIPEYPTQREQFETGCLCCATDITYYPNNLSRLYQKNREMWEFYMRAGFAEQILKIQRRKTNPDLVEKIIKNYPATLLKV